jgi:hypothetical protein
VVLPALCQHVTRCPPNDDYGLVGRRRTR